jgi:hypothetical protein
MGWRRTTWIILVTAAVSGCGSATQYRNERTPGADLTRDSTDCRNQSLVPGTEARFGGEYSRNVQVVDEDMLARCLSERGWRPVSP